MSENEEPTIEDLRVRPRVINWFSVLLGILSHAIVFQRVMQINDVRILGQVLSYQISISILQIVPFILLAALVENLYRLGEERKAIISSYVILGMAVLPPIVYIVILNPN